MNLTLKRSILRSIFFARLTRENKIGIALGLELLIRIKINYTNLSVILFILIKIERELSHGKFNSEHLFTPIIIYEIKAAQNAKDRAQDKASKATHTLIHAGCHTKAAKAIRT